MVYWHGLLVFIDTPFFNFCIIICFALASSELAGFKPVWKKQYALTPHLPFITSQTSYPPCITIFLLNRTFMWHSAVYCPLISDTIQRLYSSHWKLTSLLQLAFTHVRPDFLWIWCWGNDFLIFNFRSENFISYHSFLKTTFISNS